MTGYNEVTFVNNEVINVYLKEEISEVAGSSGSINKHGVYKTKIQFATKDKIKIEDRTIIQIKTTFNDDGQNRNYYRICLEKHIIIKGISQCTGNDSIIKRYLDKNTHNKGRYRS